MDYSLEATYYRTALVELTMESTTSAAIFYAAVLGGPMLAALLVLSLNRRAAWLVILAAYMGEVVCTEAFRARHTSRLRALAASRQFAILANGHSPSFSQRLLADLIPALVVGGIVLGAHQWLRRR